MSKPRKFEKPIGFRDLPTPLAKKKELIENQVQEQFERWGYEQIITPTLEFYDTVGEASAIPAKKLFRCMDQYGNPLVLRPDQTAPIARLVSSVLKQATLPLRLYYHASVFRSPESETGRSSEFYQSGVELVGEAGPEADAEVMELALESLAACAIRPFRIAMGHVAILHGVLEEQIEDLAARERLYQCLGQRNVVGFTKEIRQLPISQQNQDQLIQLVTHHQGKEALEWIAEQYRSDSVQRAVQHLRQVWELLCEDGWKEALMVDLSLIGSFDYYTGTYFEGYASGTGFPLLSGGRYDRLLAQFGHSLPAIGFALKINQLMEVSEVEPTHRRRILIQYPSVCRKEAARKAKQLRQEGYAVTMQLVDGESIQIVEGWERDWIKV